MLLSEDFRENPGTLGLLALWVLIFALMVYVQWGQPVAKSPWWLPEPSSITSHTSHRFGDMTWREVRQGQPWRLVTATFVHLGLIHLALNGLGLFSLGRLVEPWYRTGPFLAVCLAIGGLGNLAGGAIRQLVSVARPWLASYASTHHWPGLLERVLRGQGGPGVAVSIHTGGGSTILLGLLALGAVVGWRSKTRIGSHLQKQMLIFLGLTAALGLAMYNLVDNYGHLGGAIAGFAIGLFDRRLFDLSDRKWFRALCWASVVAVAGGCFAAAIRHDRSEARYQRQVVEIDARSRADEETFRDLGALLRHYALLVVSSKQAGNPRDELDFVAEKPLLGLDLALAIPPKIDPAQLARDRAEMVATLDRLDQNPKDLWGESIVADLREVSELGRLALDEPPAYGEVYRFVVCWRSVTKVLVADLNTLRVRKGELERSAR